MSDHPIRADVREFEALLPYVAREALAYLESLAERPVGHPDALAAAANFKRDLPERGSGAQAALAELIEQGTPAIVASAGPRFFHFVMGGSTPAAVAADWMTTVWDQVASAWVTSPLAVQLELQSIQWLRRVFDLPPQFHGVLTTGAMMANFTGLAAARQWWGERHGRDISQHGMAGLPAVPVFSSGYVHASSVKALSMLGLGRQAVTRFECDAVGRLDLEALEAALRELDGAPAILIGNAGEVNAGDFDPIDALADLAERYDAWLHVDGAFGLFARVSDQTRALAAGVERARSITTDGHKWLNVPYDCGVSFLRDVPSAKKTFALNACYLTDIEGDPPPARLGPESSRRARSFPLWATLRAYGRRGVQEIVERNLGHAARLAQLVDDAPELERLADVRLNIVCFRLHPEGAAEHELDALNEALGDALLKDGRYYVGTTKYGGNICLRPAFVNWQTTDADVDGFVAVVRSLAAELPARA